MFDPDKVYTLEEIEQIAGRRCTRARNGESQYPHLAMVTAQDWSQYDFSGEDDQHLRLIFIDGEPVATK